MSKPFADRSDEQRRVDDAVLFLVRMIAKVAAGEIADGSPKTEEAKCHEEDKEEHRLD